ncbi:MAG: hypothetical protein ROR55_23750 [Devosia sp.]
MAILCEELSDDRWARIEPLIGGERRGKRGPRGDNLSFINPGVWMTRSDSGGAA